MRRKRSGLAAALATAFASAFVGSMGFAQARAPIAIVTEDWPPYNYSENGALGGFSSEIVKAIMRDLGAAYEIRVLPGDRAKLVLDGGSRTMYYSMFRTPARESQYKWIGPIGSDTFYFYKKRGDPREIRSLDDAKKVQRVSCRNAGLVFSYLVAAGFTNLDTTTTPESIYAKVIFGRCDLAIGEPPLGVAYWLGEAGLDVDGLERTPVHILDNDLYIACSKDIPDAEIAAWQGALDGIKASGEFDRLYREYLK